MSYLFNTLIGEHLMNENQYNRLIAKLDKIIKQSNNDVDLVYLNRDCKSIIPWDLLTFIAVSLCSTAALKWWIIPDKVDLAFPELFVGMVLALGCTWWALRIWCWLTNSYKRRPYRTWKYRPSSLSQYVSTIAVIILIIVGLYMLGVTWQSVKDTIQNIGHRVSELLPLGVVSKALNSSDQDQRSLITVPTGAKITHETLSALTDRDLAQYGLDRLQADYCVTHEVPLNGCLSYIEKVNSQEEVNGSNHPIDNTIPNEPGYGISETSDNSRFRIKEPEFDYKPNTRCKECGNLATGVGRDPLNCDPTFQTYGGVYNGKTYVQRDNCYTK
jgi:hypothetical protein